ncbi:MAG TPA: hypothetical protein VGI00_16280 [Streptosporangiaceae bacterium]|jgi:hypothetical protein
MYYGTFVARPAARHPGGRIGDGREVSYAELDERSSRLGRALLGLGLACCTAGRRPSWRAAPTGIRRPDWQARAHRSSTGFTWTVLRPGWTDRVT